MAINYDKLPLEDLQALKAGNYDSVSLGTLQMLKANGGSTGSKSTKATPMNSGLKEDIAKMSGTQKFFAGVGGGMTDFVSGLKQTAAKVGNKLGVVKPETVQRITQEGENNRELLNLLKQKDTSVKPGSQQEVMGVASPSDRQEASNWSPTGAGEFVGRTAPLVTLPGGRAGSALIRVGTGALTGAGVGATSFVPEGGSRMTNMLTGAAAGATIPAVVAGIPASRNAVRSVKQRGLPFTDKFRQSKAAEQFNALMEPVNPQMGAIAQKTQAETEALVNRLKPGESPSVGQMTGGYKARAQEQKYMASDPEFAASMDAKNASLRKSSVDELNRVLGRGQDLPATQPAGITGEAQTESIKKAMKPVLSKEAKLWDAVPEYEMPATTLQATGNEMMKNPMLSTAVKKVIQQIRKAPQTVQGLQDAERVIGGAIGETMNKNNRRLLQQLKDAVGKDFNLMSKAAEAGDVALYEGKIVYPSQLRSELAGVEKRIADAATKTVPDQPDLVAMQKTLTDKGVHPANWRPADAYDKSALDKAVAAFKKYLPDEKIPIVANTGAGKAEMADLLSARETLTNKLANLQPADDVAAKYAAAKTYSREEKFERFYRGAIKKVMELGDEASGLRLTDEAIPQRLFTPRGSLDYIKAVGPKVAAEKSMPHVVEQLVSKSVNPSTGIMDIHGAVTWLDRNKVVLNNLGLTNSVNNIIKQQIPRTMREELETFALSKPDMFNNPELTALQAAKIIKKYKPSIETMYGKEGLRALADFGHTARVIGRNQNVTVAKGSTTAEKSGGEALKDLAGHAASAVAVATGHGWRFSSVKGVLKTALMPFVGASEKKLEAIIKEGLLNPEMAKVLLQIANTKTPKAALNLSEKWLRPLVAGALARQGMTPAYVPEEPTDTTGESTNDTP